MNPFGCGVLKEILPCSFFNAYCFNVTPAFLLSLVVSLREHKANKKSTMQGNLAADFELSLRNQSRIRGSAYNLFRLVQSGALEGIPVMQGSLLINGLSKVLKSKNLVFDIV